jgi:hypothetical protein
LTFSPLAPSGLPVGHHDRPSAKQVIMSGWDDLTAPEKKRAMQNYQRYEKLPPKEQHLIDQLYERWKKLPPSDRARFREQHDQQRGAGRNQR